MSSTINTNTPAGTQNTATPQTASSTAGNSSLRGVAVTDLPPDALANNSRIEISGTITDKTESQIIVSTPQGNVTVSTTAPLPVDTEVNLDIYTQKAQVLANITVERVVTDVQQEALDTLGNIVTNTPPTPLAAGDDVIATLISNTTEALPAPQGLPPSAAQDIAAVLAALTPDVIAKLPNVTEDIKNLLQQILQQPSAMSDALQKLPVGSANKMLAVLQQPEVMAFLSKTLPDNAQDALQRIGATQNFMDTAAKPILTATSGTEDNSLIAVMGRKIFQPTAGDSIKPQGSSSILKTFAPLIEAMGFSSPHSNPVSNEKALSPLLERLPQNMFQLKIAAIIPHGQQAPVLMPGQQKAVVTGTSPGGFPVIKTDAGEMILKTRASVIAGSTIIFDAKPLTPEQLLTLDSPKPVSKGDKTAFMPFFEDSWPALGDALKTLNATLPQALAADINNSLPQAGARMAPTTLFFLAALKTGLVENWLGDQAMQALRQSGKKDLAERLSRDFSSLSSIAKSEGGVEWKAISLPMLNDEQLSQVHLFMRQQKPPEDNKSGAENDFEKPMTRFILNINLSRMGDMQLDGLMQKKHIDVVLRTIDKLPESIRRELMQAYARGLEQAGMQGGISFQTKNQNWVTLEPLNHTGTTA